MDIVKGFFIGAVLAAWGWSVVMMAWAWSIA